MKSILDTNILIHIEDPKELPQNLQGLLKILRKYGHQLFIHPASLCDINNDPNPERKKITLSKIKGYPTLESPPKPDSEFLARVGKLSKFNDEMDNQILFALYKDVADFLITEDKGIHEKAAMIGLDARVLSIDSALEYFSKLHEQILPTHISLRREPVYNLDINDPFFTPLKQDYPGFVKWFEKISREGRTCWNYRDESGLIKALLILKEEEEPILTSRPLPWKRRLKICTLKVDLGGTKFGELFLKTAFQYCIDNNISEVYLTHYHKEDDALSYLLESFGFGIAGILEDKEEVYLKSLLPSENNLQSANLTQYYPCYKDDERARKFLVPIRPEYHDRLFPAYQPRQYRFTEPFEVNVPGNAIKKAYLSHSKTKRMSQGDVLLFYRSQDQRKITSIGVVEQTLYANDPDEILCFIGQRSVYSQKEVEDLAKKQVLAILFTHNLNLPTPLALNYLRAHGIIQFAPQSIMGIQHNQYKEIIKGGGVDERFTLH